MKLIDTHTHLFLPEFDPDRDDMIGRSVRNGVVKLLMPNINVRSVESMLSAADRYKDICYPMIGLHPTSVKNDYASQLDTLEEIADEHDFIAVGEIGIDLYWDRTYLQEQKEALRRQVTFAIKKYLPVVIHSRESFPEVLSVLDEFRGENFTGVFHAFSGDISDAEKAVEMGFMLGAGGPLTFKNSRLPEVVKIIGIEYIVTETDSPYLAPVPFRGKRNESSYIPIINTKLAKIFGKEEEDIASITYNNACRLFKI